MTNYLDTFAAQIIADYKNGDVDANEIVFGKVNVRDLPRLAELLGGHGSSNERNTVDDALDAIKFALKGIEV